MPLARRKVSLLLAAWPIGRSHAATLVLPNRVDISPLLVTSGQPPVASLASLSQEGMKAVIYLAPVSVAGAIAEEPALVTKQGIEFVHIPIPFGEPTEDHFAQCSAQLKRLRSKKVLVHCQVNMRASTMVFLHRVIVGKESPSLAYSAVTQVWSPQGPWLALVKRLLAKHKIDFEPF